MKTIVLFLVNIIFLSSLYSQDKVKSNYEYTIHDVLPLAEKKLDSLYSIKSLKDDRFIKALHTNSLEIRTYLSDLISFIAKDPKEDLSLTVDNAWAYKYKETTLDNKLQGYIFTLDSILKDKKTTFDYKKYLDRKSKIKDPAQAKAGNGLIESFPKATIIVFYKTQLIDIVNVEIWLIQDYMKIK
jgi:hypothetical protein